MTGKTGRAFGLGSLVGALLVAVASVAVFSSDPCTASKGPYVIGAVAGALAGVGVAWSVGRRARHAALGLLVGIVLAVVVAILDFVANYQGCFSYE